MKPEIILETERLILREMLMDDAEDMLRLHSNKEVQKYTGENVITTLEEVRNRIHEFQTRDKVHGFARWVTILKKEKKFIGWAGLSYLPEFDVIDLGYRFLPEYWGKGLATEGSKGILFYGFETLQLKNIVAIAMKENKASIRVMEKSGMEFYKIAPYEAGGEDAVWYWCDKKYITKNKRH